MTNRIDDMMATSINSEFAAIASIGLPNTCKNTPKVAAQMDHGMIRANMAHNTMQGAA